MRKIAWRLFYGFSVFGLIFSASWLLFSFIFLTKEAGTYTIYTDDGSIVCGIPIFTKANWVWLALQLFGVPLLIIAAALRSIIICRRR